MPESTKQRSYWYKGMATLFSGLPTVIEGGIKARDHAHALQRVRAMASVWSVKKLSTIKIYEMHGTKVDEEPVVELHHTSLNSNAATDSGICLPSTPSYTYEREPTVVEKYNEASFTLGTEFPKTFSTVKMKE